MKIIREMIEVEAFTEETISILKKLLIDKITESAKTNGLLWRRFKLAQKTSDLSYALATREIDLQEYLVKSKGITNDYYSHSSTLPTKILSKVLNGYCQVALNTAISVSKLFI